MKNGICLRSSFLPSSFVVSHSTFTKIELIPHAYPSIPITVKISHTVSLSLQLHHSPLLEGNIAFPSELISCRSIIDIFSYLKSFEASSSRDVIFTIEFWLTQCTPNSVSSLAEYQSLEGARKDHQGASCLVRAMQGISLSVPTHLTVEPIQESV